MRKVIVLMMVLCLFGFSLADDVAWDAGGDGSAWTDGLNWDNDAGPAVTDNAIIDSNGVGAYAVVLDDVAAQVATLSVEARQSTDSASLTVTGQRLTVNGDVELGNASQGEVSLLLDGAEMFLIDDPVDNYPVLLTNAPNSIVNISMINDTYFESEGRILVDSDGNGIMNFDVIDSEWVFYPTDDADNYIGADMKRSTFNLINATVTQNGDYPDHYDTRDYRWDAGQGETDPELRPANGGTSLNLNLVDTNMRWRGRWYTPGGNNDVNVVVLNSNIWISKWLFRSANFDTRIRLENSQILCTSYHRYAERTGGATYVDCINSTLRGSDVNWRETSNDGRMNFEDSSVYWQGDDADDIQNLIDLGKYVSYETNGVFHGPEYRSQYIDQTIQGFSVVTAVPDYNYPGLFWPHQGIPGGGPIPTRLIWEPGANAASQTLYFGTDEAEVVAGTSTSVALSADANDYLADVLPNERYYWRIVEVNDSNEWSSPLLFFQAEEGKAFDPIPSRNSVFTPVLGGTVLQWSPGGGWVDDQEVWFGTSEENLVKIADLAGDANSLNITPLVGELDLNDDYYWQINGVDDGSSIAGGYTAEGDIWRFITDDHYLIDDFESYNSIDNRIYDTWIEQGFAIVRLEETTVHGGAQGMGLDYWGDSSGKKSFGSSDFTSSDSKALVVYFYGDVTNDADLPYVALSSGSTVEYDGPASDTAAGEWIEWNIDMADFGATLTSITSVTVGMDLNDDGNAGLLIVDDIGIYPSRCVLSKSSLTADLNEDCKVDGDDLSEVADDWLEAGIGLVNATTPDANKLELLYTFESDTTGSTITDSGGKGYNGTFVTDVNETPIAIDDRIESIGAEGSSQSFKFIDNDLVAEGYAGILIPDAAGGFIDDTDAVTVTMWLINNFTQAEYDNDARDGGTMIWAMAQYVGNDRDVVLEGYANSQNESYGLRDDDESTNFGPGAWEDQTDWTHYTYTKDLDELVIYQNGVLATIDNASDNAMKDPNLIFLGCGADRVPFSGVELNDGFSGTIDNFSIYSYAFSISDALGAAGVASHVYDVADPPINSIADLVDDNKIDFKDYAEIADEWMIEDLWP